MKFTIITVVKNDKKNLLSSLKSLLSQTYKNFEYIINDGMSDDGTKPLVKKYLTKNIKYISRKDKNYYDGLNYAISNATGDYIGILNAGDLYCNSKVLEKIAKILASNKFDLLFANLLYINHRKHITRIWRLPVKRLSIISALKISSPTIFIKKKLAKGMPYNTSYSISSDTDFNLRIAKKNIKYFYLDKFIILMKTGGLSTNWKYFFIKFKQDIIILKKFFKMTFIFIYIYKIFLKIFTFKVIKKINVSSFFKTN